ncbi:MAG: AraC family transcriptional regulator [Taibaiella sp.]|nr:AraC family transcriptional regulator [Taibaiella sp.]
MNYRRYPVHPALRKWIRYFWSYDVHTPEVRALHIRSFADRYPRLVFQDITSASFIKETNGSVKPICYLSGIDTIPTDTFWDSRFSHFGVSFHAYALNAFFGLNAAELTDQTPDIQLLAKEELTHLLIAAKNHEERVAILQSYFYKKIAARSSEPIIENIFFEHWSDQLDSELQLSAIAGHYKISERQLQRRFKQSVGVSARKFSQLAKFDKALQALSSAHYGSLTRVAYDVGYADQSHFIHDFKLFSGVTPYEFVRKKTLGAESASFIYSEQPG